MEQNRTNIQDYESPMIQVFALTVSDMLCASPNGSTESMDDGDTDGWFE